MKRFFIALIIMGGITFLGTGMVNASEVEPEKKQVVQDQRPGFVDANGDGICDHYKGDRPGMGRGPGNGQGVGRTEGKGLGQGMGLKDGTGYGQRKYDGSGNGRNPGKGINCKR